MTDWSETKKKKKKSEINEEKKEFLYLFESSSQLFFRLQYI